MADTPNLRVVRITVLRANRAVPISFEPDRWESKTKAVWPHAVVCVYIYTDTVPLRIGKLLKKEFVFNIAIDGS